MGTGSTPIGCVSPSTGALPARRSPSAGVDDPERILENMIDSIHPQVVAFGDEECCGGEEDGSTSALMWFSAHFLPLMARRGYRDIVLEILPDEPEVDRELALFAGGADITETTTPNLHHFVNNYTDPGIQQLLEAARRHGVRMHGGGGNWLNHPLLAFDDRILPEMGDRAALGIRDSTLGKIRTLVAEGRNVMALNGGLHNDPSPYARHASVSFGPALRREIGSRYLAVDIFYKRTILHGPDFQPDSDWIPELGNRLRPHAGSNPSQTTCVRLRPDSYVFLLPNTAR